MKIFNPLLVIGTISILVFACKDKEDEPTGGNNGGNGKTRIQLLTQNDWKISTLVSSGTDVWNTPFVAACNKDNIYRFRTDDSLVLFDGSNKCNVSDPDSTVSFYKLYDNDTKLILNVKLTSTTTLNDTADITEISETSFRINAEYSGLPATVTFIHP